jgi:multidrug efflux system membrane fusion protein
MTLLSSVRVTPPGRPAPAFSLRLAPILLACLLLLFAAGCSANKEKEGKTGQKKKSAIPVTVAASAQKTLPLEIAATGHVEALATVEVRSQVTGTIKTVHFKEGDEVKAGELLFTIDPRPFAANLAKAEAGLAKDRAELENARREAGRYALAAQKGYVSLEQADQAATKVATLAATVQADQAAVDSARLELEYCSIRAPFAGRVGELQSDQGNLIKANADNPMVTLNRIQPILAAFTVPGGHLQDLFRYQAAGSLKVLAGNPKKPTAAELEGTLAFIDNTVDPTTGMIRLKAQFANADHGLWPGQLIDVRIRLAQRPDCVVVPSQAVQIGQKGAYVYVVKDDHAAYRPVTPGMLFQGETVIEEGLQSGERVVVDGQMQLADGVAIVERGPAPGKTGGKEVGGGEGQRGKP